MIFVYSNLKEISFLGVKFGTKLSDCFFPANTLLRLFPDNILFLENELCEKKRIFSMSKFQSCDAGRSFISKLHCSYQNYTNLVYDASISYLCGTPIQNIQNLILLLLERLLSKHQLDDLNN